MDSALAIVALTLLRPPMEAPLPSLEDSGDRCRRLAGTDPTTQGAERNDVDGVVAFEGTNTADQKLSSLRASQDDAWLHEVSVLEHHRGGRFSMKAKTPDYGEEGHLGAGASIGGLTGLALGAIAGPLGLLFWGTMGATAGGAAGDTGRVGAFDPLVEQVKAALPRNSSALILVAEPSTAEELISAAGASGQVSRQQLTDEQVDQLNDAALAGQQA